MISLIIVPDTSVVLKWFRQGEMLADQALILRQGYLDGRIRFTVPVLLVYEFTNVLRYKEEVTEDLIGEAVQSLYDMDLVWMVPTDKIMLRTVQLARQCDVTLYDAVFAALAEELRADFVTADARLANQLEAFPFVRFLGEVGEEKY